MSCYKSLIPDHLISLHKNTIGVSIITIFRWEIGFREDREIWPHLNSSGEVVFEFRYYNLRAHCITLKLCCLPEFNGLLRLESLRCTRLWYLAEVPLCCAIEIVSQMLVNLYYSCFQWDFAT